LVGLRGTMQDRPHDAFYGFGNEDDATKTTFEQDHRRAALTADILVAPTLHVIPGAAITDIEYGAGDMGPNIDSVYPTEMLGGWPGVQNVYGEVELRFDSRRPRSLGDSRAFLGRGSLASVFGGYVHQLEAGDDYVRAGVALQQFIPLGVGPRVLVLRGQGETVSGSREDVAFSELPELGTIRTLRGYPRDRFRDRVAAVASADYVFDLSRQVAASLFSDAGRVYESLDSLTFSNMRVGFGAGLSLRSKCCFIAELTVSSSIDGGIFFDLSTDSAFDVEPRMVRR
jgi:hypothetical protein